MRSNIFLAILVGLVSCAPDRSSRTPSVAVPQMQVQLDSTPADVSVGLKDDQVATYDSAYGEIVIYSVDPLKRIESFASPIGGQDQRLVAGPEGRSLIVVGDTKFAVIAEDRTAEVQPVRLVGSISSVAYDDKSGYLAVTDSVGSIALLSISPEGKIASSWVGGPQITSGKLVKQGLMLSTGELLLAQSDGSLILIDCEASIASRKWKSRTVTITDSADAPVSLSTFSYLAKSPHKDQAVSFITANTWYVVDLETSKVVHTGSLENYIVKGFSTRSVPHILIASFSGDAMLAYVDKEGEVRTMEFPGQLARIQDSVIDEAGEYIYGRYPTGKGFTYLKVRLSDSLVEGVIEIPSGETMPCIVGDKVFVSKNTAFGHVESYAFDEDKPQVLDGFNAKRLKDLAK